MLAALAISLAFTSRTGLPSMARRCSPSSGLVAQNFHYYRRIFLSKGEQLLRLSIQCCQWFCGVGTRILPERLESIGMRKN
jgi:hypothetical protein